MLEVSFIHDSPFYELAALLALAAIAGFIGQLLRQPMIVSFIAVGVLAGPSALGIVRSHEHIEDSLRAKGADLVFLPFADAADRAVERLLEATPGGRQHGDDLIDPQ